MSQDEHDRILWNIKKHPDVLGLENIITSSEEVDCYNSRRLIGAPDLVFYQKDGTYIIVEIKSSGSKSSKQKLAKQIKRAYKYYKKNIGDKVRSIGVYYDNGKLNVLEYINSKILFKHQIEYPIKDSMIRINLFDGLYSGECPVCDNELHSYRKVGDYKILEHLDKECEFKGIIKGEKI